MPSSEEKKCDPEVGTCNNCGSVGPYRVQCDNACGCHDSPSPSAGGDGWEEVFNKEFAVFTLDGLEHLGIHSSEKIKSFIHSLLERRDAEWVKKIKGLKEEIDGALPYVSLKDAKKCCGICPHLASAGNFDRTNVLATFDEWVKRNVGDKSIYAKKEVPSKDEAN